MFADCTCRAYDTNLCPACQGRQNHLLENAARRSVQDDVKEAETFSQMVVNTFLLEMSQRRKAE
jgi:hypothetical protein